MSIENLPALDAPNFCPELWQRVFVLQSNKTFCIKPCCWASPDEDVVVDDGTKIFETYNQSSFVQQLRQDNIEGKLGPVCQQCVHNESLSGISGRTYAIDRLTQMGRGTDPIKLSTQVDLNLGNLCNLACAICDPHSSTNWAPVYKKMHGEPHNSPRYKTVNRPVINDPEWFKNIELLQLQGGEVFLQSAYTEFFRNLKQHSRLSRVIVRIFTNGTVLPDPEFFELLSACKSVSIYFSIDDIGSRFEYQRYGAEWNKVVENLNWFKDNCDSTFELGIHPTYSLLNIYYLSELYEFCSTNFPRFERKIGPYNISTGSLSAHTLPTNIKQAVIDKLIKTPELAYLTQAIVADDNYDATPAIEYITKYNNAIGLNYAESHPEFWDLLTKSTHIMG